MTRTRSPFLSIEALAVVVATLPCCGCGSLPDGQRWGENATLTPGWHRVGLALEHALLEPGTWLPAAGAAVFAIDDFDRKVSDWAVRETPIFGSPSSAQSAGDALAIASGVAFGISALATPSGNDALPWTANKLQGLAVEGGGVLVTEGLVEGLKAATHRQRPNGVGHSSLPSSHAAVAFGAATLTARNLDAIEMPSAVRIGAQASAYGLAAATAWARVEAHKHYPSDVLVGAALGHFVNAFVHEAFLGVRPGEGMQVQVEPQRGGGLVLLGWTF